MGPDRRIRLFIFARIFVTFLFLVSTVIVNLREPGAIDELSYIGLVRLMAFSFLFSVVSYALLKFSAARPFIIYLQTIWDLLFVTVLLLFTGGVSSPYSFLYLLSIMNAGVLVGRREAVYTASLCGILYGAIIDFQYFGLLIPIGLLPAPAQQLGATHIFYNIFLNLMGFYLTALITGYLAEMARKTEVALREKTVDYDELAQLNTTIVSNVDSGLMTITPKGNVRVFNRYAEDVTGKSQEEVYDVPLSSIFPELAGILDQTGTASRGEFACACRDHASVILGFTAIPFTDIHGEPAGIIINFKDLTSIKQMEASLKRADRLAALGQLSARMAHEIRNPLAAMSGAVQLLSEHGAVADNDQRLLTIVMRETDRLNLLISEFLSYARPASPSKQPLELRELIEDVRLLVSADQRFDDLTILNGVPAHMTINADPNQLRQVLINLFHNAADATSRNGRVEIEASMQPGGAPWFPNAPVAVLTFTDNGAGLSEESSLHLFEPFWTTKPEGTGLGLAIIYRIIEAHGGTIKVESPPTGGCRFTIVLPV